MATFTAIKNKKQTAGVPGGVLKCVRQEKKTCAGGLRFVASHTCAPQSAYFEMMTAKQRIKKTDDRQFYRFIQSFDETDDLTPQEANAIGPELAQREFPGFEAMVAAHLDTTHIRKHLVVNSVSCETGRKLHQSADGLLKHRQANDEICAAHSLSVLEQPEKRSKKKRMKPGEYQAGLREDSWKVDLIHAINEVLEYADSRESFIANMEQEDHKVIWTDTRKRIIFVCPNGQKCRDRRLNDETFLKENLEALFIYRQAMGSLPGSVEPDEGWMGELTEGLIQLGRMIERLDDLPPLPAPPTWTDSKQRRREALKKLAMGQKLTCNTHSQGMSM